ncbi:hypothetical protein GCM10010387_04200 [Streptomyces inusitatus]|uniref:Uncharacterized protein n=1 Tax=Streptomyces inusitatus TaxID=68221 RepID=A0A918PMR3_9ACTN|nr:hypothetical protein GCM10010387_04200 [Streptomyces inusitatus]
MPGSVRVDRGAIPLFWLVVHCGTAVGRRVRAARGANARGAPGPAGRATGTVFGTAFGIETVRK